ncbi:MAG: accessory gene regulator B family protein [Lachnospiraceae bacterium]|nr:accessory gene regulator B family protein [Lachnospiraceae bacterium]
MVSGKEAKKRMEEDGILRKYGMDLLGAQLLNLGVTLLIAVISRRFLEILLFVPVFTSLRRYAGGYHGKNNRECFWLSSAIMAVSIFAIVCLENWMAVSPDAIIILALWEFATGIFICMTAPVAAEKKPLDALEKKVYGRRAILVLGIQMIIAYLLLFLIGGIGSVVVVAHSVIATSMLCAKILKYTRRPQYENPDS